MRGITQYVYKVYKASAYSRDIVSSDPSNARAVYSQEYYKILLALVERMALLPSLSFNVTQLQVSGTGGNRMEMCSLLIRAVPNITVRIHGLVKAQADTVNISISIIIIQIQVRQEKVRARL